MSSYPGNYYVQQQLKPIKAVLGGLCNGAIYGAKIRFPHSLVMAVLFGRGNLKTRLKWILETTATHSTNLAAFGFLYQAFKRSLETLNRGKHQCHPVISGFAAGYLSFGQWNSVNQQVCLYLLSRIVMALIRLLTKSSEQLSNTKASLAAFPVFSGLMFGTTAILYEFYFNCLQPSLQQSLTYCYTDSERWTCFKDFLLINKRDQF